MANGNGKLQSPLKFGDRGNFSGGPQPSGEKLQSPAKTSKGGEKSNHSNGPKN